MLALDPLTALKEANQGIARKMAPYALCACEADIADKIDLSDDAARQWAGVEAGVEAGVLAAGWFAHIVAGTTPPQWPLVESLIAKAPPARLSPVKRRRY